MNVSAMGIHWACFRPYWLVNVSYVIPAQGAARRGLTHCW